MTALTVQAFRICSVLRRTCADDPGSRPANRNATHASPCVPIRQLFAIEGVCPYDRRTSFAHDPVAFGGTAMNPADALVKSLVVEQAVAYLFAAACLFGAAILGFMVQLRFLGPTAGQFAPLCIAVGLIGVSHGILAIRLQTIVKTLTATSKAPASPASVQLPTR
jgi:hypothetical protein